MAGLSTLALLSLSAANTAGRYSDQRRAASAAERQGNYEGDLLDQNASLAERQGADVLTRGREADLRNRRDRRQLLGAQRASLAGSGVDINSGSAAQVIDNDQTLGAFDELTLRNNAAREAWGYQVQANDYRRQGGLARLAGRQDAQAMRRQSASTLLSGAGDLASIYSTAPKGIRRGGGDYTAAGYRRGGPL